MTSSLLTSRNILGGLIVALFAFGIYSFIAGELMVAGVSFLAASITIYTRGTYTEP